MRSVFVIISIRKNDCAAARKAAGAESWMGRGGGGQPCLGKHQMRSLHVLGLRRLRHWPVGHVTTREDMCASQNLSERTRRRLEELGGTARQGCSCARRRRRDRERRERESEREREREKESERARARENTREIKIGDESRPGPCSCGSGSVPVCVHIFFKKEHMCVRACVCVQESVCSRVCVLGRHNTLCAASG